MKEIIIKEADSGQRLDKYLAKYLKEAPKSFLYKMMRKKNITLNHLRCDGSEKLEAGDKICLFFSEETIIKFSGKEILPKIEEDLDSRLQVIYEDSDVIFLNKRAGELAQKAQEGDISLVEQIIAHALRKGILTPEALRTCRPSVCNRLDRNTSGLVAAGLSLPGLSFLSEQLKARDVQKYYLCLAAKSVREASELKGYLWKDEKANKVIIAKEREKLPGFAREKALWIETSYEPIAVSDKASLLRVHLITGRSHQIRAHLSYIGHPIIGDPKYGKEEINKIYKEKCKVRSQLLHAYEMKFQTIEGKFSYLSERSFYAPLPPEFIKACKAAEVVIPENIMMMLGSNHNIDRG